MVKVELKNEEIFLKSIQDAIKKQNEDNTTLHRVMLNTKIETLEYMKIIKGYYFTFKQDGTIDFVILDEKDYKIIITEDNILIG